MMKTLLTMRAVTPLHRFSYSQELAEGIQP